MNEEIVTRLRNAIALAVQGFLGAADGPSAPLRVSLPFSTMTEADWSEAVQHWRQHAPELLATVSPRPCPACGSEASRALFETYDRHEYRECGDCGCWFVPRAVDSAVFERLFQLDARARELAKSMTLAREAVSQRDADMQRIGAYLDELVELLPARARSIRYLDTGCGLGHSLRAGMRRGFVVHGIEVDAPAVASAVREGLPVTTPDQPVDGGPYDLLSFWETIEHLASPLGTLQAYLPHLAEDGLVAITVPNLDAFETRVGRETCPWVYGGYNTPGHLNLFHHRALSRLLQRAGLVLLDADGQFSGNPIELAAALSGATRGAFDLLDRRETSGSIPAGLSELLNGVWPGVGLVERASLMSPILKVIACRAGHEGQFAAAVQRRQRQRVAEMCHTVERLVSAEPDYKAMLAGLQHEVDRRDRLLAELQETANQLQRQIVTAQDEINRRDDLLLATRDDAQDEINRRDDLLLATRDDLARTLDHRIRRVVRGAYRRVSG